MAGPAFGPALAQGAAAGFQGQNLLIEQAIRQLVAQATQGQVQDQAAQRQGQGGAYDAISKLFGGGSPPSPGGPPPISPPPGQPSAPPQGMGAGPMPQPGGGAPPAPQGAPPPQGGADMPSPARAVLQGQQPQMPPQASPGGPQGMPAPQSMDLQSLTKAIDASMPNAPPQAKMAALEKVSGMMTAQAQVQFAHMKQQFDMTMQVAKLTEQAQNHLQMSMDRNASVEQRADAAHQHSETMAAIASMASADRRYGIDQRAETADRKDDTARRGQDTRAETARYGTDTRAGTARYGTDTRADTARRGQDVRSEDSRYGVDRRADTARRGQDIRSADKAADRQQRSEIAQKGFDVRDRAAGMKLTPDQQLMDRQLRSLTSRYDAVVAASGPNSPQAKAFDSQIKVLTQRFEQSLSQPAPTGPTAATATTAPVRPQGVPEGAVYSPSAKQYLDTGSGKIYDQGGKVVGTATPEQIQRAKGDGDGGGDNPESPGGGGPGDAPVERTPSGGKVQIKGRKAPSIVDEVWGRGKPPGTDDDSQLAKLMRARKGAGALDAR